MLRLQAAAGNRAVVQLVRAPLTAPAGSTVALPVLTGARPTGDGISRWPAIDRYARKAIWFYQRHGELSLRSYGSYLAAAVSTELEAVGCPGVKLLHPITDALGDFQADDWGLALNLEILRGLDQAQTIAELEPEDAALFASVVYHEGRHAEQRFRTARLLASEHHDDPLEDLQPEVAAAAQQRPLDSRTPPGERCQAALWRDYTMGEDAEYAGAVEGWRGEVVAAAKLALKPNGEHPSETRVALGRMLAGWAKQSGGGGVIRSHLQRAKERGRRPLVDDITRIDKALTRAQAEWDQLMPHPGKDDFTPLADALIDLARALSAAYRHLPTEDDAYTTGNAAYDACIRWLHSKRPPLPS